MRVGEMLDAAIKLYRQNWKTFMGIAAFVIVPYTFIQQAVVAAVTRTVDVNVGGFTVTTREGEVASAVASAVFTFGYFLFVQPFLTAAMARATSELYLGHTPSVGETYRFALSRTLSILLVSFLAAVATIAGFILLIVPGLIFLVRFTFSSTVVVVEGTTGRAALRRSWRLATGHFWKILGTLFLAALLTSIVGGILSIPFTFGSYAVGSFGWFLAAIGSSLAEVVTRPFAAIIGVLLYFDMRIRKEGLDLAIMARQLESPP